MFKRTALQNILHKPTQRTSRHDYCKNTCAACACACEMERVRIALLCVLFIFIGFGTFISWLFAFKRRACTLLALVSHGRVASQLGKSSCSHRHAQVQCACMNARSNPHTCTLTCTFERRLMHTHTHSPTVYPTLSGTDAHRYLHCFPYILAIMRYKVRNRGFICVHCCVTGLLLSVAAGSRALRRQQAH